MKRYIILATSTLILGCSTIDTNYFIFKEPSVTGSYKNKNLDVIGIEKILLPEYLRQDKIVIQTSPTQIKYLESDKWAEDMEVSLTKKLISIIQKSFNQPRVYAYPWGIATEPSIRVSVSVSRFIEYNGYVYLDGKWEINRKNNNRSSLFSIKIKTEKDTKSIVDNMNIAFDKLSHKIVIELSRK
jgi:uncharacterized lipoprotein YmbA